MVEINYKKFTDKEFEDLVLLYTPQLYAFGKLIVTDENIVQDAIQDLFLYLWEKNGRHNINNLKVYLFSAMRNNLLKLLKKQNKIILQFDFTALNTIPDLENIYETYEEIEKLLDNLSNNQKQLIYLKFYKGLNNDEISNILGINKQSVANGVFRTISYLRTNCDLSKELIFFYLLLYKTFL